MHCFLRGETHRLGTCQKRLRLQLLLGQLGVGMGRLGVWKLQGNLKGASGLVIGLQESTEAISSLCDLVPAGCSLGRASGLCTWERAVQGPLLDCPTPSRGGTAWLQGHTASRESCLALLSVIQQRTSPQREGSLCLRGSGRGSQGSLPYLKVLTPAGLHCCCCFRNKQGPAPFSGCLVPPLVSCRAHHFFLLPPIYSPCSRPTSQCFYNKN